MLSGPGRAGADPLDRLTSTAAIIVDDQNGAVLYSRNPDLPLPPASTTKILTAYIALRSGQTDEPVVVSRHASQMQPSKIWLKPGWQIKVNDLVYAVLLNSANDASVALAEGLAGSVPSFAELMNRTARRLGARNSNFVNPSGLPAEGHYSTVRDLSIIMRHALSVAPFDDVLSTPQTTIYPLAGSRRAIALRSHNRLLNDPETRVIGKTGWTREARRCFVGAATDNGRRIIVAVLGSEDLWDDVRLLVEYAFGDTNGAPREPLLIAEAAAAAEESERTAYTAGDAEWQAAAAAPLGAELRRERQRVSRTVQEREVRRQQPAVRYHVRLGSFRSRAQATRLRQRVAAGGYRATIESFPVRRNNVYRVTVGSFATRESAHKAAQKIRRTYRVAPMVVAIGT